jgi:hypothetical protein
MRVIWVGHVRLGFYGFERWLVIRYALPWAPDEPICEWMVPGTYEADL